MTIAYVYHPDCLLHDMGEAHPEQPARIHAIEDQLMASGLFDFLQQHLAPLATRRQLSRVHSLSYVDKVLSFSNQQHSEFLDSDTLVTPHTPQAALRSAGAAVFATELVLSHKTRIAFCCVRPPGHHAVRNQAMGFCFFNNVAVGAAHAIYEYGLSRVAILDFDVHHGNGTEDIFADDPRILLCSTFQHPFYPYCGAETQSKHIVNVPLPAGTSSDQFRQAILTHWLPALHKFAPQLIFISAGFDAHYEDDMSHFQLHSTDYAWITKEIMVVADRYAEGRIVSVLEGGYELHALGRSVAAHLKVLMHLS